MKPIGVGVVIVLAFLILLSLAVVSLSAGSTWIAPNRWLTDICNDNLLSDAERTILWRLRLPRILAACLIGSYLAAGGVAFQGLFRNVLAEPFVIGASSGAALGVTLAIIFGMQATILGLGSTTVMALLGALAVVAVVLLIGSSLPAPSTVSLLLAGVVISSLCAALVAGLVIINQQKGGVILSWTMGSLADSHPAGLVAAVCVGMPGLFLLVFLCRALDAYSLGDITSQSLGLDVTWFRWLLIFAASLCTAAAVSVAGVIGFVGLIAPHLGRQFVGGRHIRVLPISMLLGAALLLAADLVARTVAAPAELPVGIVTAVVGSPAFLWLLLSSSRQGWHGEGNS